VIWTSVSLLLIRLPYPMRKSKVYHDQNNIRFGEGVARSCRMVRIAGGNSPRLPPLKVAGYPGPQKRDRLSWPRAVQTCCPYRIAGRSN